MATTKQIADALIAWSLATIPELAGSYNHPPKGKTMPLPDVACEITDVSYAPADRRFASGPLQQRDQRVFEAELLFVVPSEPAQAASEKLYGYIDSLGAALRQDRTLGRRVKEVQRHPRFRLRPPFVRFDDGSEGRLLVMQIQVAELTEEA